MSNFVDVRRPEAAPETREWAPSNLKGQMYAEIGLGEEEPTPTQVKLTWDAPAEGTEWIRGYEVQRAACDGEYTALVSDTGSTETVYTDSDVEAGESYTYRVRARRPQGLSLTSNTWAVVLPGGTGEGACGAALQVEPTVEFVEEDLRFELSTHDTPLVKNTGQTSNTIGDDLDSTTIKRAQAFTTGANTFGYTLGSIGFDFLVLIGVNDAGDQLKATLNAEDDDGNPGAALCTLSDPATFTALGVQTFDAPATCPTLLPSTTYFAVIERVNPTINTHRLSHTQHNSEDTGRAAGWSIGNVRHYLDSGQSWSSMTSDPYQIEVRGAVRSTADIRLKEFNTLKAAGNTNPLGLWSDGTTMWVSHNPEQHLGDTSSPKLFAYNMATKQRDSAKDFNTLDAAGNDSPRGLWSDGSTMWVVDVTDEKIYAYDMDTKARVSSKDFNNLYRIREDVDEQSARPFGIWSDGEIMWVVDANDFAIYAYDLNTKKRVPGEDFGGLEAASNINTSGLWADESTMFVANAFNPNRIYAYWRSNKAPNPDRYITLEAGNDRARGIWSDGTTMWVTDRDDDKIYAYELPEAGLPPDTLSVEHVTDTMPWSRWTLKNWYAPTAAQSRRYR